MTLYSLRKTKYLNYGEACEVYNTDHSPVYLARTVRIGMFPVHSNDLSEVEPEKEVELIKQKSQLTLF